MLLVSTGNKKELNKKFICYRNVLSQDSCKMFGIEPSNNNWIWDFDSDSVH